MDKRCEKRNGTYTCARGEGHSGRHEVARRIRNARNEVVAIRTAHWYEGYSSVRFTQRPA